jgi:hypothetical protein
MHSQVRSWHNGMPRPQDGNEGDACRYREYQERRSQPTRGSPHLEVGQNDESFTVRTKRLRNIKQDLELGRIKSRMEVC